MDKKQSAVSGTASQANDQLQMDDSDESFTISEEQIDQVKPIKKHEIQKFKLKAKKPFPPVRPKKKLIHKYFTDGKEVTEEGVLRLENQECPFQAPDERAISAQVHVTSACVDKLKKEEFGKPLQMKLSAQGRLNQDIPNRLYVKVPPMDTKTVLDYDNDFHRAVQGRPIFDPTFTRQAYVQTARDVLKTKITIGYREDDITSINMQIENERKAIARITEKLNYYIQLFDEMLERDHNTAAMILKEADDTATMLFEKTIELKQLNKMYSSMKAAVYSAEDKWNTCKKNQKFLFYICPLHWKIENSDQILDYDQMEKMTAAEEEHMFDEISAENKESSFEVIVETIQRECELAVPPKLYFKEPEEVLEIFKYMEIQNLNYLLHAEDLAVPLDIIRTSMDASIEAFDNQINNMTKNINELAVAIQWEENRVEELQNLAMSLIYNDFKNLIMAEEILNLHIFVEDVYESCVGPNDANYNMLEMMTAIEKTYRAHILVLDQTPQEIVASLEGSCFTEQMKMMKAAETAVKQFAELDILTKQLKRAYAPKYEKGRGKEPKNRSKLIVPPKPKPPPERGLTQKQEEYLEFFTDFCKHTDDPEKCGVRKHIYGFPDHKASASAKSDDRRSLISRTSVISKRSRKNTINSRP